MEAYDHDDDLDTEIDESEYDDALRRGDLDRERDRCVLGSACLNPTPMHVASECFDAEMMEAYYAEIDGGIHG